MVAIFDQCFGTGSTQDKVASESQMDKVKESAGISTGIHEDSGYKASAYEQKGKW